MTKKKLILLATITIIGFSTLSYCIHYFTDKRSFFTLFDSNVHIVVQILTGGTLGLLVGYLGWRLCQTKLLKSEINNYIQMFDVKSLSNTSIIIVSVSAGIGEEIFFRGIVQQYLGIVLTAIIFVAIHGYLNPKNWVISIYGIFMTLAIIILGIFSNKIGLITAIVAHTVIDVVLLYNTKTLLKESST